MDIKAIQLCSLTEYPFPPETDFKLNPLSTLPKQKLSKLATVLATYANDLDGFLNVHPGIIAEVNHTLAS
jgi:hypothetical protein